MILLDTCTLLWRSFEKEKLSEKARKSIDSSREWGISSISVWEIGIKVKNGQLPFPLEIEAYVFRLKQLDGFKFLPVDESIWIESLNLDWNHRDPADRVIVATAKKLQLPLVTNDKAIREFYRKTVW